VRVTDRNGDITGDPNKPDLPDNGTDWDNAYTDLADALERVRDPI